MGFKRIRDELISALRDGRFEHEDRSEAGKKNLLYSGQVDPEFVIQLLKRCRGDQHEAGTHHYDDSQPIDIFRIPFEGRRWYLKSYFIEEGGIRAVFLSVHLDRG